MGKLCSFTNHLSGENFFSAVVIISPLMEEILTGELFEKWVGRKITRLVSSNPIDIRIGGAVLSAFCFLSVHVFSDLTFLKDCSSFEKRMQDVFVFGLVTSAIRNLSGSSLNSYLFHAGNNFLGGLALHRLNYQLRCTRAY